MPDILSERLVALVSAQVSAVDNQTTNARVPAVSAYLDTMADMLRKAFTHITTPSTTLVSGGSAGAVAVTVAGAVSGIQGMFQGVPFQLSAAGSLSGSPTSLASTGTTQIRKVLVTIGMSALPVASSLGLAGGTVQFVYGSAYNTLSQAASTGGVSSLFNKVPLPKPSANEIPVGWLNIPNSFAVSTGLADTMMITDYREVQGYNFSLIMTDVVQP